jgi:ubiquinone/menaquinone biosynthesis C-methylase UbiE
MLAALRALLASRLVDPRVHEAVLRRAALRDGERFLEAGVGDGATFVPLARRNVTGTCVGIDTSEAALARCRRRLARAGADGPGVTLEPADVRALPYPDESFDLALACFLLGELSSAESERALDELRRVLRVGGRLLLVQQTTGGLAQLATTLGLGRPLELGPALSARFRDVSRLVYRRPGVPVVVELLRAVKL